MSVDNWPPISASSMMKIMIKKDAHFWPSGCVNMMTGKGEFIIPSGVLAEDDVVLKEWLRKRGSFQLSGGTCGSFLHAIKRAQDVDEGVSRRGNRHLHADSTNPSQPRLNHPIIATFLATFQSPVARHDDKNKATRDFPLTGQGKHQMPVPICCSCCCHLGEFADNQDDSKVMMRTNSVERWEAQAAAKGLDEQQTGVYMDQMRTKQADNAAQALKRKALKQADADELEELREDKRRREQQQEQAPAPTPATFADVAVRDAARLRQVLGAIP